MKENAITCFWACIVMIFLCEFLTQLDAKSVGNGTTTRHAAHGSLKVKARDLEPYVITNNSTDDGESKVLSSDEVDEVDDEGVYGDDEILFEGDIVITMEKLRKFYDINETMEKQLLLKHGRRNNRIHKRGATSDEGRLWTSKTVPYTISSSFNSTQRQTINGAIQEWSEETCIRFVSRSNQNDYIHFDLSTGECSSKIGRTGGCQRIRLTNNCAYSHRVVLHEIGHALGLWHEQSRPDRDSYVTILWNNIIPDERDNFDKKSEKSVDFQGSEYDYRSIMHYRDDSFNNCISCKTIRVNNEIAYNAQGQPTLGRAANLSDSDAAQVNRLYKCPGRGRSGFLALYIRNGVNLEDTDPLAGNPDPYVKITAVDSSGRQYTRKTSHIQGDRNPTWNEWLFFSDRAWQFIRLKTIDNDIVFDDDMSMSVTVPLLENPTSSSRRKFCNNIACNRYVWYDYKLLSTIRGSLRVKVRYARNLPDTDGWWNDPDPYVRIRAIQSTGSTVSKRTRDISGTRNPTWNQWLDMGCRSFVGFSVQIFDEDVLFDDSMSTLELKEISAGSHTNIKHCTSPSSCGSYLYLDYQLNRDGNECSPNPCRNGGMCREGCASFSCSCPSSYTGDRCQYRQGGLTIYARYGRGLPDRDGWLAGDSDPYMRVTAYDHNGYSRTRTTRTRRGDESPDWNQNLNFGTDTWRRFEVSVWDEDVGSDDRLSSTSTWYLPSTSSRSQSYVRMNANSGYVIFDYTYT